MPHHKPARTTLLAGFAFIPATNSRILLTRQAVPINLAAMDPEHFFFYGTLRPGQHNYFALLHEMKDVIHVGQGRTVERYTMLASGYPFVLRHLASTRIRGDVFTIRSREVILRVDELEGHTGRARGYRRGPVDIELDAGGRKVCWMYLYYGTPLAEEVPDGDWLALSAQ